MSVDARLPLWQLLDPALGELGDELLDAFEHVHGERQRARRLDELRNRYTGRARRGRRR